LFTGREPEIESIVTAVTGGVGHAMPAQAFLQQALEIFQRIGAAEAQAVRAELDALTR
jgi:hypothetical protein